MNVELRYLLEMIRFVFGCGECPQWDCTVDFMSLYQICKMHHIESLVASGLVKCSYKGDIDSKAYKKFMDAWKLDVMVDVTQQKEMELLFDAFEEQHVVYVPLKGIYVKKLYPSSELRTMSDLDVLYKGEQESIVDSVLDSLGYICEDKNTHQHVFVKKPFMNVEMHLNLVDDGSRFDEYYKNIFDRLIHKEGYRYEMSYNDFYVFHIAHLAKHFMTGGCGLRFLIDLHVLETKMSDQMDRDYVDKELKKLNIFDFEQHICELTRILFSNQEVDGLYLETLLYMYHSGVYGNMSNAGANRVSLKDKNTRMGKLKSIKDTIFQPYKEISRYYTYVKNYPFLLPVAWVHRFARNIFKIKKTSAIMKSNFVDEELVQARRTFLHQVGIEEDY